MSEDKKGAAAVLATVFSSLVAVSSTVVCITYWMCVFAGNQDDYVRTPGWVSGMAAVTFFGGAALWLASWFLFWSLPEAQRKRLRLRHLIGAVMLLLLLAAPIFAEPTVARKVAGPVSFDHAS